MDKETGIIFKYEEIIIAVFHKRPPATVALKQILVDFCDEIKSINPPKSKFMEEWERVDLGIHQLGLGGGLRKVFKNLAGLIDKYKEDK